MFTQDIKYTDNINNWRELKTKIIEVYSLLENNNYNETEIKQAEQNYNNNKYNNNINNNNNNDTYFGCKFLTSSQLFTLQLRYF